MTRRCRIDYARELGFEVMANFMKSYTISPAELARKARTLVEHRAETIYVVDSRGHAAPRSRRVLPGA